MYSPTKYTQHKIKYKKWSYNDETNKVYPRPTVPHRVIDLKMKTKSLWFSTNKYQDKAVYIADQFYIIVVHKILTGFCSLLLVHVYTLLFF